MDPNPNPHPTDAQAEPEPKAPEKRLAALSLRGADLPPDFAAAEIDEDMEAEADAEDDDDDEEGYLTAASRGGSSSCATAAWKEEMEGLDEDADAGPPSPSSSGYVAERGSSLASSGGIVEPEPEGHAAGAEDWARDKKHLDEDDASASWRKRKKHFFILSNSGKPIYSRYGDEHKLAGFSATLQAIVSFVENSGDHIKFVRAGKHQMLLISTKSVNRCLEKNPKFDMAPLLGGTDAVFLSHLHAFSWNPATFLHAYTFLPLALSTRQVAGSVLQDIADSGVLFALLMCEHKVISLVGAQKATLHPDDILLLANFILSSESFRTSESFSPICLPRHDRCN